MLRKMTGADCVTVYVRDGVTEDTGGPTWRVTLRSPAFDAPGDREEPVTEINGVPREVSRHPSRHPVGVQGKESFGRRYLRIEDDTSIRRHAIIFISVLKTRCKFVKHRDSKESLQWYKKDVNEGLFVLAPSMVVSLSVLSSLGPIFSYILSVRSRQNDSPPEIYPASVDPYPSPPHPAPSSDCPDGSTYYFF